MLRETLKQELDQLNESQLRTIADFVATIKHQSQKLTEAMPFWQRVTSVERVEDLQIWISQLPDTHVSLPDEAFDRGNIYE
jgi:hypothetical protein